MAPVVQGESGPIFVGGVDDCEDLAEAAAIASACPGYARDDDDECYADGDAPTCFNCRARRWVRTGFTCIKGLLAG